jgi:DNA-binding PadR family transcriptional regulator
MERRPSKAALKLLAALAESPAQWRHGYDITIATGLKSGTLYPLMIRLEQSGLLEAMWQPPAMPGRPPRHAYRLTAAGRRLAAEVSAGVGEDAGARTREASA